MEVCEHEALEFLLQGGFYPPWHTRTGQRLLAETGRIAREQSMQLLFKYTGVTASSTVEDISSLLICSLRGDVNDNLACYLVSQGADVNACDRSGVPALILAVRAPREVSNRLADMLIEAGADISKNHDPLFAAIRRRNYSFLIRIIKAGANITLRGPGGKTPLMLAVCTHRGDALVEVILNHATVDHDAKDDNNETAPQLATAWGASSSVRLLLAHGANTNQFTAEGFSLLSHAARHGASKFLHYLIDAGADLNALS